MRRRRAKRRAHLYCARAARLPNEFAEARRIVVSDGFRIAERLEHRIRLDDLILERNLLLRFCRRNNAGAFVRRLLLRGADRREIGDNLFRVLRFAGARLAGDEHRLIFVIFKRRGERLKKMAAAATTTTTTQLAIGRQTLEHISICLIGDGEKMRRHFGAAFA